MSGPPAWPSPGPEIIIGTTRITVTARATLLKDKQSQEALKWLRTWTLKSEGPHLLSQSLPSTDWVTFLAS